MRTRCVWKGLEVIFTQMWKAVVVMAVGTWLFYECFRNINGPLPRSLIHHLFSLHFCIPCGVVVSVHISICSEYSGTKKLFSVHVYGKSRNRSRVLEVIYFMGPVGPIYFDY